MRWKNHKKVRKLSWLSFMHAFFITIFLSAKNVHADTPSAIGVEPLTDQQLSALINKADKTNLIATPPKLNGHDIYLQVSARSASSPSLNLSTINLSKNIPNQRCSYDNLDYVLGDMVNTENGWIKCTSSIIFSSDNPSTPQQGLAVWIKIY